MSGTLLRWHRRLIAARWRQLPDQLGLDGASDGRLEALFVLAITLGLRPGELRALTWDRVNLDLGIIHIWRHPSPGARSCSPSVHGRPHGAQETPGRRTARAG
jgi:integrase